MTASILTRSTGAEEEPSPFALIFRAGGRRGNLLRMEPLTVVGSSRAERWLEKFEAEVHDSLDHFDRADAAASESVTAEIQNTSHTNKRPIILRQSGFEHTCKKQKGEPLCDPESKLGTFALCVCQVLWCCHCQTRQPCLRLPCSLVGC